MNINKTIYILSILLISSSLYCNPLKRELTQIIEGFNDGTTTQDNALLSLSKLKSKAQLSSMKLCRLISYHMQTIQAQNLNPNVFNPFGGNEGEILFEAIEPTATDQPDNILDWLLQD